MNKPDLPLCCMIHPHGAGVCFYCKQPACLDHQSDTGVGHTFCETKDDKTLKVAGKKING